MLNMVFEPIAQGLSGKKGTSSKRRVGTQEKLRRSNLSPEVKDQILEDQITNMGLVIK